MSDENAADTLAKEVENVEITDDKMSDEAKDAPKTDANNNGDNNNNEDNNNNDDNNNNNEDNNNEDNEDEDAGDKFMGIKPRRRSSATKTFAGDALNLEHTTDFLARARSAHGEEVVLLSDFASVFNSENAIEQRAVAVTEGSVYLLDPLHGFSTVRRCALSGCTGVSLSRLPDNFFAVHFAASEGGDLLCLSARKTEFVTVLGDAFRDVHGTGLEVNFANEFGFVLAGEEQPRKIRFEKSGVPGDDEGVRYFLAAPPKQ